MSLQKDLFPSWSFSCLYLQKNPDTVAELVLELYGIFRAPGKLIFLNSKDLPEKREIPKQKAAIT